MAGLDSIKDVQSSMRAGYPEIQIQYDRELLRQYNLSTSNAAQMVKSKVQGQKASTLSFGDERIDLTVRLMEQDVKTLTNSKASTSIHRSHQPFPYPLWRHSLKRNHQKFAVLINNAQRFYLPTWMVSICLVRHLTYRGCCPTWMIQFNGSSLDNPKKWVNLSPQCSLRWDSPYFWSTSSWRLRLRVSSIPFVILFSVPLAIVGVIVGLWMLSMPISVINLIGTIVLSGVVVNNAIVLVDTINRKRTDGLDKDTAIFEAAKLRLRPIAITTLTDGVGLIAFGTRLR